MSDKVVAKWKRRRPGASVSVHGYELNEKGQVRWLGINPGIYGAWLSCVDYSAVHMWQYLATTAPDEATLNWDLSWPHDVWPRGGASTQAAPKAPSNPKPDVCAHAELVPYATFTDAHLKTFSERAREDAIRQWAADQKRSALRTMRSYPLCKWGHAVEWVIDQLPTQRATGVGFRCGHCSESLLAWKRSSI